MIEIKLVLVLLAIGLLPGWTVLSFGSLWRRWKGLQRWIVATGISIAFFPAFFYFSRALLPFVTFDRFKLGGLLLGCALLIALKMHKHWREIFSLDRYEWLALAVFGMTLFSRLWTTRYQPYPAWSDSFHHTLLTQLTTVLGQLPANLEPYFPISLNRYHLGLYSLSASTAWLANVPAETALLWTAQFLNGLCGLGIYLVLDRKVGRTGAIVGAAVVGLLSHQPAFYVNWGRFTQIASQTLMLIAWMVTWDTIALFRRQGHRRRYLQVLVAGVLNAAVFMFHFRVAAFYIALLAISALWELWRAFQQKQSGRLLIGIIAVGALALLAVSPVLWEALSAHASHYAGKSTGPGMVSEATRLFYRFPWSTVPVLALRPWLLYVTGLSAAIGLYRRNKLAMASLLWVALLILMGNTYLLGIPALNITNMGAVLIMLYLPAGLIIGAAVEEVLTLMQAACRTKLTPIFFGLTLAIGFIGSHVRIADTEPFRYFVTPEDVTAMEWIKQNTPQDALFAVNTFSGSRTPPTGRMPGTGSPTIPAARLRLA